MKNNFLILSLLVCSFFTACSSDDDGTNSIDPIIGTWKYALTKDGEKLEISECEMLDTVIFNAEGTISTRIHYDYGSGCELETEGTGQWVSQGKGVYSFTSYQGNDDIEPQVIFFDNNNSFSMEYKEEGTTYKEIYTRTE